MNNTWLILQSIVAILITVAVLLQSQGGGLGQAFGGGGGENYHTRRGLEKVLFNSTIVLIVLFAVISIGSLLSQ